MMSVLCSGHIPQACCETFSYMRCPKAPGKGGFSNPGSSRPNLTHITIRGMMKTPGQSYYIFWIKYYKKQDLMSNMLQTKYLPRVLSFVMQGSLSYAPLHASLAACIQVCAGVGCAEQALKGEHP